VFPSMYLVDREVHRTQHVWVALYQRHGVEGVVGTLTDTVIRFF